VLIARILGGITPEYPQYGYTIVKHLRQMPGIKIQGEAEIYPILKKMEQNKLIRSYWKLKVSIRLTHLDHQI
jgi:DNA-binding PadR family transcriptional regulator